MGFSMKRIIVKLLAWVPAIVVGLMIMGFSSQDGVSSQGLSDKVAARMLHFANEIHMVTVTEDNEAILVEKMQVPIRKAAHMTEYAIFTLCVVLGLYAFGVRGARLTAIAVGTTFVFACTDEIHQLFVPGRSGQFTDVLIDTLGGAMGLFAKKIIKMH